MAEMMVGLIQKNLVDPSFSEWVMPDFTTTTDTDRPAVSRLSRFLVRSQIYSRELNTCPNWVQKLLSGTMRLKPVLTRFVGTFDSPGSPKTKDFWQNIVHYMTGGSGPAICLTGSLPFVFGMRMGIPSFILVAVNVWLF
jgi:Domain of unknown function (DUF4419)